MQDKYNIFFFVNMLIIVFFWKKLKKTARTTPPSQRRALPLDKKPDSLPDKDWYGPGSDTTTRPVRDTTFSKTHRNAAISHVKPYRVPRVPPWC